MAAPSSLTARARLDLQNELVTVKTEATAKFLRIQGLLQLALMEVDGGPSATVVARNQELEQELMECRQEMATLQQVLEDKDDELKTQKETIDELKNEKAELEASEETLSRQIEQFENGECAQGEAMWTLIDLLDRALGPEQLSDDRELYAIRRAMDDFRDACRPEPDAEMEQLRLRELTQACKPKKKRR
jgi:chromosome segregation ATPase